MVDSQDEMRDSKATGVPPGNSTFPGAHDCEWGVADEGWLINGPDIVFSLTQKFQRQAMILAVQASQRHSIHSSLYASARSNFEKFRPSINFVS